MGAVAFATKPAILIASAGIALGVVAMLAYRAYRRAGETGTEMLPRIDVHAYNDALLAP